MIRRIIDKVFGRKPRAAAGSSAKILALAAHGIRRVQLDDCALKTCETLAQAGFKGYLVRGAVRDLLLDITPKDFDIVTDARPEQVKPLFRRALLIGRRFRLVHVMIGGETVETSTYRSADADITEKDAHSRVLHDNVFGTQEDDARRRDFTINALYSDPGTEEIVDFHGGLVDLKKHVLRMFGDPAPPGRSSRPSRPRPRARRR